MFEAARGGHILCLTMLKRSGADPFHQVDYGATAMHIAAFNGHADCVRLFARWGCNPNTLTEEGCTALHYAAYMGHVSCAKLLLSLGCSPWIRSKESVWGKKHNNQNRVALDYAREQYTCDDSTCVCQSQIADQAKKAQCEAIIEQAMQEIPSLADLCRQLVRQTTDINEVDSLPLPPMLSSYVKYEVECETSISFSLSSRKTNRHTHPAA